jgi:hypothetical protein
MSRHDDGTWMAEAACRDHPGLPWLDDRGLVTVLESVAMTLVCARCPVLRVCDAYADGTRVRAGFWAGRHRDPTWEDEDPVLGGAA